MITIHEEWLIERLDWSVCRDPEDARGIDEQLYAQLMGWA